MTQGRFLRIPIFIRDKKQRTLLSAAVNILDFENFEGKHLVKIRHLENGPPSLYTNSGFIWVSGEIRYDPPEQYLYVNLDLD
jgi:hypothetical protein